MTESTHPIQLDPEEVANLGRIASRVARVAGEKIFSLRQDGVRLAGLKSSSVDMVTEADTAAEQLIVQTILGVRPDDGFLGEEGAGREGTSGITWVIDPIDGTTNYFYGISAYCVSIAATVLDSSTFSDGRRAIAAAVYNPETDELYTATAGGGAYLNGKPLQVRVPESPERPENNKELSVSISNAYEQAHTHAVLETALVGTGFGYTRERKEEQLKVLHHVLPQVRDIRRIGSAALDLCRLAAGEIDVFYEIGLHPWDYQGGALVAMEAGAHLRGLGDALPGNQMLIAGHLEFVTALAALITAA